LEKLKENKEVLHSQIRSLINICTIIPGHCYGLKVTKLAVIQLQVWMDAAFDLIICSGWYFN